MRARYSGDLARERAERTAAGGEEEEVDGDDHLELGVLVVA